MKSIFLSMMFVMLTGCSLMAADILDSSIETDQAVLALEAKVKDAVLADSDLNSALKLYANAARSNSDNPYFKDQYSILRRVIKMKSAFDKASSSADKPNDTVMKRLDSYYQAIRAYYYSKGFYNESLKLDDAARNIIPGEQQVLNYIESLVVTNPENASDTVSAISGDIKSESGQLELYNLLLQSRKAKSDTLIAELEKITVDPEANPHSLIYVAGIYKNAGDKAKAYEMIQMALEHTVPSEINGTRILASSLQEFKKEAKAKDFVAVLETESKVAQSGCTGGSSCNSCSLKGKCGSSN